MGFKKKVDFLQIERDELPARRPVILYVTAPVCSKDYTQRTSQYKHFKSDPSLPDGVLKRAGNPFNFCSIEVNPRMEEFETQMKSALRQYREAAHKVVVINAHGESDGVLLKEEEGKSEEKLILSGRHFGELITPHTHEHNLHVFIFASYGHTFGAQLYNYVQKGCVDKVNEVVAVTYFTSETCPSSWDRITTAGNGHVEVTREVGEFIKSKIEPNSPYKILEAKVKPQCVIL